MEAKLLQELKDKLEAEKERLIEELSNISRPDQGDHVVGDFQPKMPDYGSDTGDDPEGSPNEVEDYEVNVDTTNKLEKRLNEIEAALAKIEEGNYGICENCGQEIKIERLRANPAALTCVRCA